jgi:hypothetical protein
MAAPRKPRQPKSVEAEWRELSDAFATINKYMEKFAGSPQQPPSSALLCFAGCTSLALTGCTQLPVPCTLGCTGMLCTSRPVAPTVAKPQPKTTARKAKGRSSARRASTRARAR